jgi:hypothetical protein
MSDSPRRMLLVGLLIGAALTLLVWRAVRETTPGVVSEANRASLQEIERRLREGPDLSQRFVDVAALLEPSVVSIHTYEQRGFGRMEGKGLGTGIVLDEEGHILDERPRRPGPGPTGGPLPGRAGRVRRRRGEVRRSG